MTEHLYGKGKAIFCGFNLGDAYRLYDGEHPEDTGRHLLWKALEREAGIEDQSWIYGVTVDAIRRASAIQVEEWEKMPVGR
jgi:hypothetical protein